MKNKPKYWPGTDILKSTNNDFNWRKRVPTVAREITQYQTKSRAGSKGAGRELILEAVQYIKNNRPEITRFVTLSPKTTMAEQFHLKNGAVVFRENENTVNYEYETTVLG